MTRFSVFRRFAALLLLTSALAVPHMLHAQTDSDTPGDPAVAQMGVKVTQLEEEIRRLQGSIEQLGYQNRQLKEQMDKSNADMAYRLDALEKKNAAAPSAAAPTIATPGQDTGSDTLKPTEPPPPADDEDAPAPGKETAIAPAQKFASSREQYNAAITQLHQAKYPEAGAAFAAFAQQHPKDPLIGNAYYWLGETYYVRRDYVKASDNFRKGYQVLPTGPKAADNLLKLAISLNAMNKDKESCIVLHQVVTKFGAGDNSVKSRAEQEINRIGCS